MENEFHVGAAVACTDGPAGKLRQVIVDPNTETVTHLVVDAQPHFGIPVLVPRQQVARAERDGIQLACTQDALKRMDPLEEVMFTAPAAPLSGLGYQPSQYLYPAQGNTLVGPLAAPPAQPPIVEDQVPPGEVVVGHDSVVLSRDGEELGHVDEVGTDLATGRLSHLLVRSGILWAAHSARIPASAIDVVEEGTVRLRLTRDEAATLADDEAGATTSREELGTAPMTVAPTGPSGAAVVAPEVVAVPAPAASAGSSLTPIAASGDARPARVVRPPEAVAPAGVGTDVDAATSAHVVGLFRTRDEAQQAVDALLAAGFPSDAMSAITPEGHTVDFPTAGEQQVDRGTRNTAIGAAVGALVGFAIFGPLLLVAGAVAGGLAGMLSSLGASREQAEYLAERVRGGHFLVVVRAGDRRPEAVSTLENAGATDVHAMAG